jgi:hypothetical protein
METKMKVTKVQAASINYGRGRDSHSKSALYLIDTGAAKFNLYSDAKRYMDRARWNLVPAENDNWPARGLFQSKREALTWLEQHPTGQYSAEEL